jgi:hypothetical protein
MEVGMIELGLEDFHEHNYEDAGFCLYVMKNGLDEVLYIGISTVDVWDRWFGWGGHMTWDGKVIYGESPIAVRIENHLPESLHWKIQLWTLKDCIEFCSKELPEHTTEITIHNIEPIMIRKLSPVLNATYNLNPREDATFKSKKEVDRQEFLDKAYREIFNKKPSRS